jgi:ADP-heptose:LPS heptosyltransferase/GT2 family glycosyltransferase
VRFTVSILCHVALRQAKACIASIQRSPLPFRLILTANGNPDAAAYFTQLSAEFPNITVVVNEKNEGYIGPQSHAFSLCETEVFIMLNDDTLLPADWLVKIGAEFDKFPTGALVAPKGGCQSLRADFHGFNGPQFEYLNGACLACKTEVLRKHGLFDPHLKWAYGDDADTCLRMRELGYTLHYADFTLQHEIGATSRFVKEVRVNQSANHMYLQKRWAWYLRVRTFGYPIVVKRGAAHGDVLLTTPIVRAIHERSPLSEIYVETLTPAIYANHPFVKKADRRINMGPQAQVIDLDRSYETHPDRHIIDSYAIKAELENIVHRTELYLHDSDKTFAEKRLPDGRWCAVHAGPSTWKSKEWPLDRWQALIPALQEAGFKVVLVGSHGPNLPCDVDQRGGTTIHQMAALIQRCQLFVGLDSLPFHCAEAVGTRAIGLFGITDPKYISTRDGGASCVCGTTASFGLRHRIKNATTVDDGGEAMKSITLQMVLDRINLPCPAIS